MTTPIAVRFRNDIESLRAALMAFPPERASLPWRPGGWNRRQIVGHLLDSSSNNRQRFVRASIDGVYAGPGYAQEAWVAAHGYDDLSWPTLVDWWNVEQDILIRIVDRIPAGRLQSLCTIGNDEPVTLSFLIDDYIQHQRHHFLQIEAAPHQA